MAGGYPSSSCRASSRRRPGAPPHLKMARRLAVARETMISMLTALIRYATPPSSLAGRLSLQSLVFASGDGTFLAGSAVFFTLVVGLSLGQVGIGLTVAAIASFVV